MGETKELKRKVQEIPAEQMPTNVKMPQQLSEEELRQEVARLRSILVQADNKIKELANGWGIKRLEFLFKILEDAGFEDEVETKVRNLIVEELGVNNAEPTE
jgi:hypothetical protein